VRAVRRVRAGRQPFQGRREGRRDGGTDGRTEGRTEGGREGGDGGRGGREGGREGETEGLWGAGPQAGRRSTDHPGEGQYKCILTIQAPHAAGPSRAARLHGHRVRLHGHHVPRPPPGPARHGMACGCRGWRGACWVTVAGTARPASRRPFIQAGQQVPGWERPGEPEESWFIRARARATIQRRAALKGSMTGGES
jgi:hypothetical protein